MILVLILVILALAALWCIKTSNDFKRKEIRVEEGLSGVEVALTKRCDMLSKMMDTARGYMAHESELFTRVIQLRRGMSIAELNDAQQQMDSLSGRFFAVAEGYPELRSSAVFTELQRGIRDAEEHLQAARRLYNTNVTASQHRHRLCSRQSFWPAAGGQGILCRRGKQAGRCKADVLTGERWIWKKKRS